MGDIAQMPTDAEAMIERIGPAQAVSSIGRIGDAKVYRSEEISEAQTGGITTYAARLDLPATVGATLRSGTWLNAATERYPAAVLGSSAAQRLGVGSIGPDTQVVVGGVRFAVVGVMNPVAPDETVSRLVRSAESVRSSSAPDEDESPTTLTMAAMPMAMPSADRKARNGRVRRPTAPTLRRWPVPDTESRAPVGSPGIDRDDHHDPRRIPGNLWIPRASTPSCGNLLLVPKPLTIEK